MTQRHPYFVDVWARSRNLSTVSTKSIRPPFGGMEGHTIDISCALDRARVPESYEEVHRNSCSNAVQIRRAAQVSTFQGRLNGK